ncbi:MAG: hypothetical protein GX592_04020 [Clostridiales bacterium]|nr:hypothetical protein [Clostridiales bacterium]
MRAWLRTALFLLILFLIVLLLFPAARPKTDSGMDMVRQMYVQPREIDIVICGHSQVFSGYNPGVLTDALSDEVYVLSSAQQSALDSFYLLRETLRHHEVGTLFMQVNTATLRLNRERGELGSVQLIHGMRPSLNRLEFSVDATGYPFFLVQLEGVVKSQVATVQNLLKLAPLREIFDREEFLRWKHDEEWPTDRGFASSKKVINPDGPF